MRPFRRATGTVATFDGPRGLGTVRADDGTELPFHCTAIADGTRTVDEGRRVAFAVVPGGLGRWEAADVSDLASTTAGADTTDTDGAATPGPG